MNAMSLSVSQMVMASSATRQGSSCLHDQKMNRVEHFRAYGFMNYDLSSMFSLAFITSQNTKAEQAGLRLHYNVDALD